MISLKLEGPGDVLSGVARRARERRLQMNLTQAGLSERSGVSLGTLKLFERSGTVSLETLVKIAFALEAEDGFSSLFPSSEPLSIDDILEKPKRIRGRRA